MIDAFRKVNDLSHMIQCIFLFLVVVVVSQCFFFLFIFKYSLRQCCNNRAFTESNGTHNWHTQYDLQYADI